MTFNIVSQSLSYGAHSVPKPFNKLNHFNFYRGWIIEHALNNLLRYYTENDVSTKVRGRRYD